jgi:ATP-dependent exoDNAse (exonuclease V) alpha subunit
MTMNKAQGQTFNKVGIFLNEPVFSHGQLYVAFSRARSSDDVSIFIKPTIMQGQLNRKNRGITYTKNCVYKELFLVINAKIA